MELLRTQIQIHWSNFHILEAKQNAELSDSPVKTCNLQQVRGKFIWF